MNDIINQENNRLTGKEAQKNNILAAKIIAETIKTTLGPCGMDKMLVDRFGNITITNDGATILNEMEVEHPIAKIMIEIANTQEKEAGDGTTSVVMLAGKLLENAESLIDKKIHPTIIIKGYQIACKKAIEILEQNSYEINTIQDLEKISITAMTGKVAEPLKEHLSKIIVEAAKTIQENNVIRLENIKIEKELGDSVEKSCLIKGLIIDQGKTSIEMPSKIQNAKILLVEEPLEIKTPEIESRISISSAEEFSNIIKKEQEILKTKAEQIIKSGANAVFAQRGIDEKIQNYLSRNKIYAVRRVSKSDMNLLSKATGAKIVSKIEEITPQDLGFAGLIEEKTSDNGQKTFVLDCKNPKAITILIKGGSDQVLDEIERAIKDSLGDINSAIRDPKIVAGGGSIEIEISKKLYEFSLKFSGREKLAIEEFAKALEVIPLTLAENAGLDPIDTTNEIKALHESGKTNYGLNLLTGKIEDNLKAGIIEPLKLKKQAIISATEVATMILRIDDVIAAKKKNQKEEEKNVIEDFD